MKTEATLEPHELQSWEYVSELNENRTAGDARMTSGYVLTAYESRVEEGDFCAVYFQEGWDGYANNLDLFTYMKSKGWTLIAADVRTHNKMGGKNLAENTLAEFLFERK